MNSLLYYNSTHMSLYQETLNLLKADPRAKEAIASGAGISYSWVSKFHSEQFGNPGVHTVQKLHDYLENGNEGHNFKRPRPKPKRAP